MKDGGASVGEFLIISCSCTSTMDEGDNGSVDDSQALVVRRLEEDRDEGPRNELLQMQRIRELDMEPLEEEEDDSEAGPSVSDNDSRFLSPPVQLYRLLAVAGS